jgi:hypothetical protein
MDEGLVSQLAQFAWEAFRATKPQGVSGAADLTAAAESTLRLFGDDPIDASLDGLGDKEIAALRICIELDSANAVQKNQAVVTLAQAFEPFIKRLLARVDEAAFDRYRRSSRSFDLKKSLAHLGLGLAGNVGPEQIDRHDSPQREIDWAYVARNECAHGAPKWSRADRDRRCEALIAAMLLAAHQHNRSLTTAHAVVDWGDLTRRILNQAGIDHVRSRFVTLIAGEQALAPIEPTASETAWIDPFDTAPDTFDENDKEDVRDDDDADDDPDISRLLSNHRRGKVAQLIHEIGRFLLIGRPGAGKTTSLRMVEWLLASDLAEGTQPLAPILVELKRCRPSAGAGVLALAAKRMGVRDASHILSEAGVVLLLDGVNEVAESEFDAVQIEIDEILTAYPDLSVVITSRPGWHRNQARLPVFALDPLDDNRIEDFLQKNMRPEIVPKFLADLRSFPKLWSMARNPLTLAMLARVGEESGGVVPDNRAIVLKRFFEWMAQREASKSMQINTHIKCILLARLAWDMRTEGVMAISTGRALSSLAIARTDLAIGVSGNEFLDEVADNGFIQHNAGEVSFEHEVFLEYFAATELSRRAESDPTLATRLSNDSRWKEPVLLAYGLAERDSNIRLQVNEGLASVAAEALSEQRDTTDDERALLARTIAARPPQSSSGTDTLIGLIVLGDGDAIVSWAKEHSNRSSLFQAIDYTAVDLCQLIRATVSVFKAEAQLDPSGSRKWIDRHGNTIRQSRRPSKRLVACLCRRTDLIANEHTPTLERLVQEALLPRPYRHEMLKALAVHLPSLLLVRDECEPVIHKKLRLAADLGDTTILPFTDLARLLLLSGRLWRALPACVVAVTGPGRESLLDRCGPPATAGRDWQRLIRMNAVDDLATHALVDWIDRCLTPTLSDSAVIEGYSGYSKGSQRLFLFAPDPLPILFRCASALLSLIPDASFTPPLLREACRQITFSNRGTTPKHWKTIFTYLRSHAELAHAAPKDFRIHFHVRELLSFVRSNVPAIIRATQLEAAPVNPQLLSTLSAVRIVEPISDDEASAFDKKYLGLRFGMTVIAAKADTRYRFLRIDGTQGQIAFYWPPNNAIHVPLNGGERVSAEIRSTWIKKKDCWGIKAVDVRLEE